MDKQQFDIIVVGGGINGAGIAADAAGRNVSVALFEKNDLASATSSASSKLIHGGLRYLEHGAFRLVGEALKERELLLNMAPHLVEPLRIHLPYSAQSRPWWQLRLGLKLYDALAQSSTLPHSQSYFDSSNTALKAQHRHGLSYSDCWVDDARLVIANAQLAQQHGAHIAPYHEVLSAKLHRQGWQLDVRDTLSGQRLRYYCRTLVNAAGPWSEHFIRENLGYTSPLQLRLVKGSHIVLPKLYAEDHGYILQHNDGRIVFVLPYQGDYSLIGTTDVDHPHAPCAVSIDDAEITYLLSVVNTYFTRQLSHHDVVHSYAGLRPLCLDKQASAAKVSRDYQLKLQRFPNRALLLSVFGGKLTTYRKLAENAVNRLVEHYPNLGAPWTHKTQLPGGKLPLPLHDYIHALQQRHVELAPSLVARWTHHYGNACLHLLNQPLGTHFGGELYQSEVQYLIHHEWARTSDDILWRRTKQGLRLNAEQVKLLDKYVAQQIAQTPRQAQ